MPSVLGKLFRSARPIAAHPTSLAWKNRDCQGFSHLGVIRTDWRLGTRLAFFSGVNLPATSPTSSASTTTPRIAARPSTAAAPADAFASVLSGKSCAIPSSPGASRSNRDSSQQETRRTERHQQSGTLQSPQPLPPNIAPIAAPTALATSVSLSSALSSGIEVSTPVNAAIEPSVNPSTGVQDPPASDGRAAARIGSAGLVGNSVAGRVSTTNGLSTNDLSTNDLTSTSARLPSAAPPDGKIAELTPVLGEHDAAPQAGATSNQPIVAEAATTSLDLPLAQAALLGEMTALANELPTSQPHPDLPADSSNGAGTSQTSTRAVPETKSASLAGKTLGKGVARLPQVPFLTDNTVTDATKVDSPASGRVSSHSAEKGAAASAGVDPLGTASSGSGDNPVPVVPGGTLLSSSAVPAPVPASGPVAIPSPATHGQPAASAPDLAATTQPRSADATDPAAPLSRVDVARLVRSVSGSELRVGVHSEEFGAVTIHAALGREQLSAHISTENERLGSALSAHLSSMQGNLDDRLGKGFTLKTTVSVSSDSSTGSSTNRESAGHESSAQQGSSSFGGNSSGREHRYDPFTSIDSVSTAARPSVPTIPLLQNPLDRLSIRI